jgi:2-amino-4-hydroxy-6-hydroxymethyldihydropteridine diphosphokinase
MSRGGRSDPATFSGYLGLGSNLGDRRGHLQDAVDALPGRGVDVLASSSVYETEPVGEVLDQPAFLNAAVAVRTELDPEAVLEASKAIERDLGRKAGGRRHAPRPIDIDLLLFGDAPYASERLRLPHGEVTSRRFVLVPLLELDPDLRTPDGASLRDALDALPESGWVRPHSGPLRT